MAMTQVTTLFPSLDIQILCCVLCLLALTLLTHLVSRRITIENIDSLSSIAYVSAARICLCLVFIDSWIFVFTSAILLFGIGLERSTKMCSLGIILCLMFYASSKALIYAFLVEKAHIVWTPITGHKRTSSPIFHFCASLMLGYVVLIVVLFIGRVSHIEPSGVCVIGLEHFASIPLIGFDLCINLILTCLFLWPVARARITNPAIRSIALRTVTAATIALISSAVNITILTILHGREKGWLCLSSCITDVCVNAVALSWVAKGKHSTLRASREKPKPVLTIRTNRQTVTPTALIRPEVPFTPQNGDVWPPAASKSAIIDADLPLSPMSAGTRVDSPPRSGPLGRLFGKQREDGQEIQVTVTHEYDQTVESALHQLEVGEHDDMESYYMKEMDITAKK